jgi:hypothetical protein
MKGQRRKRRWRIWRTGAELASGLVNVLTLIGKAWFGIPIALLALGGVVQPLAIAACVLVLIAALLSFYVARSRRPASGARTRGEGLARLFAVLGALLLALTLVTRALPLISVVVAVIAVLLALAIAESLREARRLQAKEFRSSSAARSCPLAGFLPVATILPLAVALLLAGAACLALAVDNDHRSRPPSLGGGEAESTVEGNGSEVGSGTDKIGNGVDGEAEEALPTYADDCPELEDPREIGHGLGALFEHDGAVKAGCGQEAEEVTGLGVWYSAGICDGSLRSFAVSAPDREAVILYGDAAMAAWEAAQESDLLGAEAIEPGAGDLDLIRRRGGSEAYVRASRGGASGDEEPRTCSDVGEISEPFVRLSPAMIYLWRELLDQRAKWSWPTPAATSTGQEVLAEVAFIDYNSGETIAGGSCEPEEGDCRLEVDGEAWTASGGPSFFELGELTTFAPKHTS